MAQNVFQIDPSIIEVTESVLTHPDPGDGLVDAGQPVLIPAANLAGFATISAKAATDKIPVDVARPHNISVAGKGDAGAGETNEAVAFGDLLYYDAGVINKDEINGTRFGVALGAVNSGATATIPVLPLQP